MNRLLINLCADEISVIRLMIGPRGTITQFMKNVEANLALTLY